MKKSIFTFLLSLFVLLLNLNAQHTVVLSGITFTPDNLTIDVGDMVTWDNQDGTHNVNGSAQSYPNNPEAFGNGGAMTAPWTFNHTFNIAGTYNYHCDPHFGVGMTGVITVVATPATDDVVITELNYNNPGNDDYEFVELFNNGPAAIDMTDWTISDAVDFTFPAFTLNAGEYAIVANNAAAFEAAFGIMPFQFTGALNNTGEDVILSDATGAQADIVSYSDSAPWPASADGFGPTLSLCDVNTDNNDPTNWAASITPTGFSVDGTEILGTPGAANECPAGPIVGFLFNGFTVLEDAGTVFATLILSNGNANTTDVTLEMDGNSTATNGDDFTLTLPQTVTFDAGVALDTQIVPIAVVNDTDIETLEQLILNLTNPTNNAIISANGGQYTLTILDNDAPQTNAIVITGVFDTQVESGGTWAKGIELQALDTIPDLSVFGVGSANNGGGSSGVETQLPAISVSAGDCIYIVNDSLLFIDFFGFSPTVAGGAANINGDDAIELFENNIVIDVFGEINTDGTGEPWEYLDGWAYRNSGTGPDGGNFELGNWLFSGINVFDLVADNASAPSPFPTCAYSTIAPTMPVANDDSANTPINESTIVNVLGNDVTPNPLISMIITSGPDNGTTTVNGLNDITYEPDPDFCGTDGFIYEICDMNGCDEAFVTINVVCPTAYPAYDIATVTSVNGNGQPDSLGVTCQLQGIMHGINLQASADRLQFAMIDGTGGITVFEFDDFGLTYDEGDEFIVQGTIDQFNCLTQMRPDTLWKVSTGNALVTPEITTIINESFESDLIQLTNLTFVDPSEWLGNGSFFTVEVTNGTFINTLFIDDDTELSSMPIPTEPFHAIGLGGQFDSSPCVGGYQLLPRYADDIIELTGTVDPALAQQISFYPNPVANVLTIDSGLDIASVSISNLLGQVLQVSEDPSNALDVSDLHTGIYLITFQVGGSIWTGKFVKE